jgi:AP2 domain
MSTAVLKPRPVPVADAPGLACGVPLYGRGGVIRAFAFVDAEDFEWAMQYRWHLQKKPADRTGYAVRRDPARPNHKLLMHRELLGLDPGDSREGDHINRRSLDNRRGNLRAVGGGCQPQNVSRRRRPGSSRYRGVSFCKQTGRWAARVNVDGRQHHLGRFDTEQEAADAAATFREHNMPYSEEASSK